MSNPFDSAQSSDEKRAPTDQEIAPAAEIRAYLARHGGPVPAVTPIVAEPTPAATAASSISATPEPIVVEPPPVAVEDTATEIPISVDAKAATPPVEIEPVEPAAAESVITGLPEPEAVISEPVQVTPAPELIAVESTPVAAEPEAAAVASTVSEPAVGEIGPTAAIAPPQSTVSPAPANANSIDIVPERVTNTAAAREAPARSGGQQMQAR
ncbi:MAG: hypothetical protein JO289_18280, partial [Xanthobacteraceae bacterium]|nr:hypothetical protein [Xanthobacteraceae bacterium]